MKESLEFEQKSRRMLALLDEHNLDGLLLQRTSSFAWATCGVRADVNLASTIGVARLLVTRNGRYLITNNLEETRYEQNPLIAGQGWEICISPWYSEQDLLPQLSKGLRLGADSPHPNTVDLSSEVAKQRSHLTDAEQDRMRTLGKLCAEIVESTARESRPGMSELELSARLTCQAARRDVQAITNIVASDERITSYRHPLSTSKHIERLVMLVICGRKDGLVCSVTRFVHFGRIDRDLATVNHKAAWIAAVGLHYTRPKTEWGEVFERIRKAYGEVGIPEEWVIHHQGGPAGYEPREAFARPGLHWQVKIGQAGVWNPSVGPARSVDTFLVGELENELVTDSPDWPKLQTKVNEKLYIRPTILEID
jgi:Xaa-Pro aminopeptidase